MFTEDRSPFRVGAALATSALALAACSSGSAASIPKPSGDTSPLSFTACGTCSGTLDGATYKIQMPTTWNGTLLLWSHGYRTAVSTPPANAPVDTAAEDAPSAATATTLLGQG